MVATEVTIEDIAHDLETHQHESAKHNKLLIVAWIGDQGLSAGQEDVE